MLAALRAASIAAVCTLVLSADLDLSTADGDDVISATRTADAKPKRSVKRCIRYSQTKGADELSVDLELKNRCKFAVTCEIQWDVVCASKTADSVSRGVELASKEATTLNASAATCGDGDWEIADVKWSCSTE